MSLKCEIFLQCSPPVTCHVSPVTFPSPVLSKLRFLFLLTGLVYARNLVKNAVKRCTKTMNKTKNIVEDYS